MNHCKYRLLEMEKEVLNDMLKNTQQYTKYVDTSKLISRILSNIEEVEKQKEEIKSSIESIKDDLIKKIFVLKYIEGKTWEQMANIVYYSNTHLMRLFKKACNSPEIAKIKNIVE